MQEKTCVAYLGEKTEMCICVFVFGRHSLYKLCKDGGFTKPVGTSYLCKACIERACHIQTHMCTFSVFFPKYVTHVFFFHICVFNVVLFLNYKVIAIL